jgi:hypothetical protein
MRPPMLEYSPSVFSRTTADLFLPVVGQHLAVLLVIAAVGEVEIVKAQRQAEALGRRAQHAQALGHDFLANAVASDHGNLLHHSSPLKKAEASASTTSGTSSAM